MTPRCPHCHARTPRSPGPTARFLVLAGAWTWVMLMAFGAGIIGPFVLILIPFLALASVGVVAAAHDYAHGDRICAACGLVYEIDGEPVAARPLAAEAMHVPLAA